MEQNVDVFSLVISKLNDNDMWFTTKADPTVEEARNYYKLDEYGNPTETTINKIVKEVNSLIGDGAVNEYDAVDLWINDALVAYTVDYRDNLVTQFEDKPVVDGIEAYENSVQFPHSKKIESRKIVEGVLKNIQLEDEIDEWRVYSADVDTKLGKNIISTFKNYEDDEGNVITNIRIDYNTSNNKYIVNYVDNNGGFHQINYKLSDEELAQIVGNKKTESNKKERFYVQGPDEFDIANGLEDTPSWDIMDSNTDDFYCDEDGNYYHFYNEDEAIEACKKLNNKKTEAKTKKVEGAGAGYTVSGTLTNIRVNSYEILDTYVDNSDYGGQERCFNLKCDIDVDIEDMEFHSYEYGGSLDFPVEAKITNLVLFDYNYDEDSNENVELDDSGIESAIDGITFEDVLGAGWTHQTFTGTFETSMDGSSYSELSADNGIISIKNDIITKFIDAKVTGEVDMSTYEVLDETGDTMVDDFTNEDEAIQYAKKNGGVQVIQVWHNWKLTSPNGDEDEDDPEYDTVWERDFDKKYKYDDIEESKKVKKENADNHEYKSEYDELDDLLDIYAGIDNGKLELYNVFNNDSMKEFDDDEYDMWLEDMKNEHFDELMAYLKEKDEETSYYMSKINESKKRQIEAFKNRNVNFNKCTKDENKQLQMTENGTDRFVYCNDYEELYNYIEKLTFNFDTQLYRKLMDMAYRFESKGYNVSEAGAEIRHYLFKNNLIHMTDMVTEASELKTENYQKRLDEVNNKSKNLISDMFSNSDFDSDSPQGKIIMRTSEMFNALSDKGYDVEVTFDNGESTSAIQLGQQGGKVLITITNTNQPLRAFTSGNFEINDQNIEILQDIQDQINVL